jgi:hypothetical protein
MYKSKKAALEAFTASGAVVIAEHNCPPPYKLAVYREGTMQVSGSEYIFVWDGKGSYSKVKDLTVVGDTLVLQMHGGSAMTYRLKEVSK